LSPDFTSKVMRRVERRDILRELALESTMKMSVVVGAFVVLSTTFLLLGIADLHAMESFLEKYRMLILPGAGILLFTWLFNDIILKYLLHRPAGEGLTAGG
jgi:hypothetical protein